MEPLTVALVVHGIGAALTTVPYTILALTFAALGRGEDFGLFFVYGILVIILWPIALWPLLYLVLWQADSD